VISSLDSTLVIAAQCIFRRDAWHGEIEMGNLQGHEWRGQAADSVARLQALKPDRVLLSHDVAIE
jgi:hypothetical protein